MRVSNVLGMALGGAVGVVAIACGSGSGISEFETIDRNQSAQNETDGDPPPVGNFDDDAGRDGAVQPPSDDGGACATVAAEAKLTPVNLVVMYDRSGSMGDTNENPSYDPAKRWIPVGEAMKAFFGDPSSAGLNASLKFFPDLNNSCTGSDYETPDVARTALPSSNLVTTVADAKPKGDTPTRAAVAGAIVQAKAIRDAHPDEKTVIVLVTDGEPYGCGIYNDTQSNAEAQLVAQDVAKVVSEVNTYVIGIGPSVGNLQAVATAGGTTAFQVEVGSAPKTTSDLLDAMNAIRGNLARCDFDIPAPPDGRKLDFDKVFVTFTPGNGTPETLPYSADCSDPNGWHFDDPKAPKKVLLCTSTCDTVRADKAGKINVAFACEKRPDAQVK